MKKYIPLLIIASLLLSACSLNWSNRDDLFEKKQACEKYSTNVIKDIGWDFLDVVTMRKIDGIFYSPRLQTCIFRIWIYKDITVEWQYDDRVSQSLYDYFSRKYIKVKDDAWKEWEYIDNSNSTYLEKKILELTWE